MRTIILISILLTANFCFGQKNLIGLFGKCDDELSGYMCQQILFNADGTFQFYDLLHLSGWSVSEGNWKRKGDTVVLNSSEEPYAISYIGNSSSDSIIIYVNDFDEALQFAVLYIDNSEYSTELSGRIKIPRKEFDTLKISYITTYSGLIEIEIDKFLKADTLEIKMKTDFFRKYYFDNEKWLFQDKKLYHTKNEAKEFDLEMYFEKAKNSDLKFSEDY